MIEREARRGRRRPAHLRRRGFHSSESWSESRWGRPECTNFTCNADTVGLWGKDRHTRSCRSASRRRRVDQESGMNAYLASYRGIQVTVESVLLLLKSPTLARSRSRGHTKAVPAANFKALGHRRRAKTGHPSCRSENHYVAI
jgi:hypothetical protein